MPRKWKSNCATCVAAKGDLSLRKRIRYAAYQRVQGDETLYDIADEIGIGRQSIYNHVKRHMEDLSDSQASRRETQTAKKVAIIKAQVQQELETTLDADTVAEVEGRPLEIVGLDEYITQGAALIQRGEMKITAQTYLAAVKIKTEWSSKQQNNKIELLRTMAAFSSGSRKPTLQPKGIQTTHIIEGDTADGDRITEEITSSLVGGQESPGDIYRRTFGHVTAQGSKSLS